MSHNDTRCEKAQSINNPGALAMHKQACDTCGKEPDGTALQVNDVEPHEIEPVTANMDDADMQATMDALGFNPKDGDTLSTACAKALIDAKGGGGGLYTTVFGRCGAEDCEYGANGFDTGRCAWHERDEPDENEPSDDDRAEYVADLLDVGVAPDKAEQAADARFD